MTVGPLCKVVWHDVEGVLRLIFESWREAEMALILATENIVAVKWLHRKCKWEIQEYIVEPDETYSFISQGREFVFLDFRAHLAYSLVMVNDFHELIPRSVLLVYRNGQEFPLPVSEHLLQRRNENIVRQK